MSRWQIVSEGEGATSLLATQLQSRTPVRAVVPMVDREMHASRFVSHLAGDTVSDKPSNPNSRAHLSLTQRLADLRQAAAEELVWADSRELVVLP